MSCGWRQGRRLFPLCFSEVKIFSYLREERRTPSSYVVARLVPSHGGQNGLAVPVRAGPPSEVCLVRVGSVTGFVRTDCCTELGLSCPSAVGLRRTPAHADLPCAERRQLTAQGAGGALSPPSGVARMRSSRGGHPASLRAGLLAAPEPSLRERWVPPRRPPRSWGSCGW